MILDGLVTDPQHAGDLLIAHAAHDAGKYLHLAVGKGMKGRAGLAIRLARAFHLFVYPGVQFAVGKDVPRNGVFPIRHRADGSRKAIRFDLFGAIARRPSQHGVDRLFDVVVPGQQNHARRQMLGSDLVRHLLTVHLRHVHIQHGDHRLDRAD